MTRKGIHTCTRYVQAALFLEIGLCAEFLIFSARAPGVFFMSRPSPYLMLGTALGGIVLSLLVRFAPGFGDLTGTDVIYCWIYSVIIFLLADCAKLIFIASFHITSVVLEELPDDHEAHEEEEHIDDDHKELLQGKRGSVHKRPKVAATNPGGLKGLLTHGNTRDAGMAIYPSLADEDYKHLTGPQKVAARAQRRASRGSVVSY